MADIRIKVAKDKAKLVKALRAGEGSTGPFQTYYEVLAFAAAVGIKKQKYIPFSEVETSREIDPIRQEQFISKGFDQLIQLLAVAHSNNPRVLSKDFDAEKERIEIFESYANGGLFLIQEVVKGCQDYSSQILLLLHDQKQKIVDDDLLSWDILDSL